jgi:ribonuclease HI
MYIIHTDGGARGNPGPAATGVIIKHDKKLLASFGTYLGVTTNNVAEYKALIEAFFYLLTYRKEQREEVICYLDSELVVKQLTGIYKVKDENLKQLVSTIRDSVNQWGTTVKFHHVTRDKNTQADAMVNNILDSKGP